MLANVFTKTTQDRWRGMLIGTASLAALLLMGMAVYRDIDLSLYTDLPEVWRTLMNIPADADVAALAYGAIYSSYGALTLAGLSISIGAAAIAGEERDGTLGLLLGNPRSRSSVLTSKTAAMVLLTLAGTVVLWGAAVIVPELLDVNVAGMQLNAFILHMLLNALFYGFLALAVGAWTGKKGLASGVAAGVMVVSFFAVGLFQLIEGWERAAEAFPWYYFIGSDPLLNGVDWGHVGVLLVGIVGLASASLVGVNRRDLRDRMAGQNLLDRLRSSPVTQTVANRLAGSTRVSRISIKTASEHQGLTFVVGAVMFFIMGLLIGPMYNFIDDTLRELGDMFPEALLALFGGGDMGTAEGFYQVETFGLMAPIAVMVVTVAIGARALAGEEARRTIGLLLANPVRRSTIVLEKAVAMTALAFAVGVATFAGVAGGSLLGNLGMSIANIAATCLLVTLLGLVIGAVALVLSAATGRVRIAIFGATGVALVGHVVSALLPLNDSLAGWARWSPFSYYLNSDPLLNGMHWGHGAILATLAALLIAASVPLFQRRDLRQTG